MPVLTRAGHPRQPFRPRCQGMRVYPEPRMKTQDDIEPMFDELTDLTTQQRDAVKARYHFLMKTYRYRCRVYSYLFYILRLIMTVGSLTVPALLSLPSSSSTGGTYWFTWATSLAVTTANGILTLFKLDKRFFMLHATAERLRTETWQYIMLAGRYSGHHGHGRPSHASQYVYYCSQIEKIHMKQIDEEFIKNADLDGSHPPQQPPHAPVNGGIRAGDTVMVPSPADVAPSAAPRSRQRSESVDTIGTNGSATDQAQAAAAAAKPGDTVQMLIREREAVSGDGDARITILSESPEVSARPADRSGTAVSTGSVQQEPTGPGNT